MTGALGLLGVLLLPAAGADAAGLELVPGPVRARVTAVVQGHVPCVPGDPFAAVQIDRQARRIVLCAGADAGLQTVFGAFLLFDAEAGWSQRPSWRRLNGWSRGTVTPWSLRPANQASEAYAAPSGQQSPERDLASFAAAFVAERAGGASALTCRLLPQARFLHARLSELTAVPAALAPPPRCPAFETWAARETLERIEVVLATPSTVTMASMFGHVFLRLVRRERTGQQHGPLDDPTLAFLVESAQPITEERFYALKGITGVYQATLAERSFLETYRTYVVSEGRDLRRFHLHLGADETGALLERLWSLRQAGRFDYYFFSTNCATLMVDLLNSVLPEARAITAPVALATTPAGTLEGYAFARTAAGGPLVTFIPDTTFSHAHEAQRAAADRAQLRARLEGRFAAFDWRDGDAADPGARARAYRKVGALAASLGATAAGPAGQDRQDLQGFLRASAVIEAHLSTVANQAAESAEASLRRVRLHAALAALRVRLGRAIDHAGACALDLRGALAQTADDLRSQRLAGYQATARLLAAPCAQPLGDELRRLVLLETEARADADALAPTLRDQLLFPAPDRLLGEQEYARGLEELIDDPHVTRISEPLRAVQEAKRALGTPYPAALLAQEAHAREQEEAALHARAVPRTGIDELEVGAGAARVGQGQSDAWRGVLLLAGAMHDERLGDQRRFGFAAHTGLTVLRSQLAIARAGRGATVAQYQTRLVGYRSLRPAPVLARGPNLGGELALDIGGRPGSARPLELRLGGGALLPLLSTPSLANHLLLGAGPVASFDQMTRGDRAGLGLTAALEARVGLSPAVPAAFAVARAELRPLWTTRGWARALAADAELRVPLAEAVPWPLGGPARGLSLRLHAGLQSWQAWDGAALDARSTLALAFE